MTGGVLSIFTVTGTELLSPAPFVADQDNVVPSVSVVRLFELQPVEDAIPDSGSVTLQLTVTLLVYQPLAPAVPVIVGAITGGVVSLFWNRPKGEREITLPHTMLLAMFCELVTSTHAFPSK